MSTDQPIVIIIDLFCGAGGLTTGAIDARIGRMKVAKVIACVNHDANAIASHQANHPEVEHYTEDVRTLDLNQLKYDLAVARLKYPDAAVILWASLECTNFSIAKGGQSRDGDSRTLADTLYMAYDAESNTYIDGDSYIQLLQPDYIYIENVKEFKEWGPLVQKTDKNTLLPLCDRKGKPVMVPDPRHKGIYFEDWRENIHRLGYTSDWRLLNSKDFGACQSRLRFFMQYAKIGLPIAWPPATHGKPGSGLKKYRAVKEVLDLTDEGISIFNRKENEDIPKRQQKDLCEKTMQRIYAGLVKWVAKGDDSFISKYFSGHPENKNISANGPAGTIKCIDGQAVVKCIFITKYMGNNAKTGVNNGISIDEPSVTIPTSDRLGLVQCFGVKYHGTGENLPDMNEPGSTISTKDRTGLVNIYWMDRQYSSGTPTNSIDNPADTVTQIYKSSMVKVFLMSTHFNNIGQLVDAPAPTMTAGRHAHYILTPGWGWDLKDIDKPCPTIIARQDKAPHYLVHIGSGEMGIAVFENDSPTVEKIKMFMAAYGITDIKMRMLSLAEQMAIQGFPPTYKMRGTITQQKKYNGNAVEVHQARACITAVAGALMGQLIEVEK